MDPCCLFRFCCCCFFYLYAPWRPHSYISSSMLLEPASQRWVSAFSYNFITAYSLSLDFCSWYIIQYLIYIPIYPFRYQNVNLPNSPIEVYIPGKFHNLMCVSFYMIFLLPPMNAAENNDFELTDHPHNAMQSFFFFSVKDKKNDSELPAHPLRPSETG